MEPRSSSRVVRRAIALAVAAAVVPVAIAAAAPADHIDGAASATARAERVGAHTPPLPGGPIPPVGQPVDTSNPDRVIGNGTPSGCTSAAVVAAVAAGGVITFDCGPDPVTIEMTATAKVVNTSRTVVLDGGGLVTLSGRNERRILYMNTCDRAQIWTTPHCQNQDHPQLTIQRLRFVDGNSTGDLVEGGGGGAVFVRGGRVKVLDSTFAGNRCDPTGPDIGGGALRVLSQYQGLPVIVARSSFADNVCSNGGATSSIGVSWRMINSVFTNNSAIGVGANPQRPGTPGGGNGGGIYLDGNEMTLSLENSVVTDNVANEGGGGIFFVSNNRSGTMQLTASTLLRNPSLGFETAGFPGIFYLGSGPIGVTDSTIG